MLLETSSTSSAEPPLDEASYLAFVDEQIAWFRQHADWAHRAYNVLRIATVVLGAILPALTSKDWNDLATLVAIAVTVLVGLEAVFKPGDVWRHHRGIELELMRLKRRYRRSKITCKPNDPDPGGKLFQGVEELLAEEPETFWNLRVTREKEEDK